MNRRGFFGALLAAPLAALAAKHARPAAPPTPAKTTVRIPAQWSTATDYDITYSDGTCSTTWYMLDDGVPWTYTNSRLA